MFDFLDVAPLSRGVSDSCRSRPKNTCDFLTFIPVSTSTTFQQECDQEEEIEGFADLATSAMMMLQGLLSVTRMATPAGAVMAMAPPPPPSMLRTMPAPVAQTSVAPECEVEPTQRDNSRAWFLLRAVQSLTAAHVGVGLAQAYTMDLYSGIYNGMLGLLGVVNALPDRNPDRLKTYVVFAFLQGSAQALQLLSVLFMPNPFPLTLANSLLILSPAVSFTASYFSWQYVCEMRQLNTVKGAAANQLLWAAAAFGRPTALPPLEIRQRALARVSGGPSPGSLPVITEDPEDTASVHST
ncbi:hypothetical protein FOZ62_021143 [Perkinsus olseni]|uniref:Uncharacterized protein n=1 Tax=Perkinsus olseni TaxID=32597 RepID=A0A7J6RE92_PEROL|nr:hypothetical protein FOZ62_021143 [Perkinsus olseni]